MDFLLICLTALAASGLTLFSGFGLGTLLMPVFALFFPVEVAVAQTALVHLANNLFKLGLFGRNASWRMVLLFGGPAFLASFLGARTLLWLADLAPLATYTAFGSHQFALHPVKLVVAMLMAGFSILELWPAFAKLSIDRKYIPAGGLLSGFFGGLSGNQGAFRSAFLIKSGLNKETFIGTGVVIAMLVDFSRLTIYSGLLASPEVRGNLPLILAATLAAFLGAFLGSRLVRKVTIRTLQVTVAIMLLFIALLLGLGII
jgi:uncharacterized membrane protein YfcA